jgi:hypothetical protein
MTKPLRIGSGAGFAGDRLDPALVLAERGAIDYLGMECLGERTVALAQLRRRKDPTKGYDPLLERRVERLLPLIRRGGFRLGRCGLGRSVLDRRRFGRSVQRVVVLRRRVSRDLS